jgi:putative endonuclease
MATHASIPHSMENATLTHHASQVLASLMWPTYCPDPSTAVCKRRRPPLGINNACKCVPILIIIVLYYMYIMANVSGVLYTGVTNYLERRVADHKQKLRDGFAKKYDVTRLVYQGERRSRTWRGDSGWPGGGAPVARPFRHEWERPYLHGSGWEGGWVELCSERGQAIAEFREFQDGPRIALLLGPITMPQTG